MYQFTALLNIKEKDAYLSGNQNCSLSLNKTEMYEIARSTQGLKLTAPYSLWATKLKSINDFAFHIFQDENKEVVKVHAEQYAKNNGCTIIGKGRPTLL